LGATPRIDSKDLLILSILPPEEEMISSKCLEGGYIIPGVTKNDKSLNSRRRFFFSRIGGK